MKHLVAIVGLIALTACVGHELQTIDLPDGTHQVVVTSWVKHPIGPNTQSDVVYRCTTNSDVCVAIHEQTGTGGGILDLVPAAALDSAVGLSNMKAPSTSVTVSGGGASAVAAGGSATGGNASATAAAAPGKKDKH